MAFRPGKRFWIVLTTVIVAVTALSAGRNLLHAWRIHRQIRLLEEQRALYLERIARDSTLLEALKDNDFLERYAREHYYMHRPGEKVYIVK